ncbi:MAG: hypothetical protein R2865_08850 [Deinococcales bacterium]
MPVSPLRRLLLSPNGKTVRRSFLAEFARRVAPLYGFIQTTLKPEASLHLSGPEDAPILASWRYGLGRVIAFSSQGAGRWSRDWISDPFYPLLWSQAVRWVLTPLAKPGLHVNLSAGDDAIHIVAEAVNETGRGLLGFTPWRR